MAFNVEIKARLRDRAGVEATLKTLRAAGPTVLRQLDVFFPTPTGRLKLRTINDAAGELIHYDRPDATGPKTSDYAIAAVPSPADMRTVLARAFGEKTVVEKVRTLYLIGPTRIHLDEVKGLGDFLEFEVVLNSADQAEAGRKIADDLLARLGIAPEDLVTGAYADLLASSTTQRS
ncbi:MAG: class IV adenylate cyclase [Tepidisphaeraceae bacterium]